VNAGSRETSVRQSVARWPLRVHVFIRPFEPWHDPYQAYYHAGLRESCALDGHDFVLESSARFRRTLRLLRRGLDAGYPKRIGGTLLESALTKAGRKLEGSVHTPSGLFQWLIGQYVIETADDAYRVCIDSADYPWIVSDELLAWSDVYFKANAWTTFSYDERVRPIVNGDPFVLDIVDELRRHRSTAKKYDVSFVVRVWGGQDNVGGIEHNLKLLQAINRVRGNKFVLAVLLAGDIERDARYLRSIGVNSTTKDISRAELWRLTAASRQVVIRLGMHYCVPWRMIGALASGACVVLDRAPFTAWPEPLVANRNFLDLELPVGPETPVATEASYDAVPSKIESWLEAPGLIEHVARENAAYFDNFAAPAQVGRHITSAAGSIG
jgi:hypothetical protein